MGWFKLNTNVSLLGNLGIVSDVGLIKRLSRRMSEAVTGFLGHWHSYQYFRFVVELWAL